MLKILSEDELVKRTRTSESRFEKMPVWDELKELLDSKGLKRGSGTQISLTKADMQKYDINEPRTIYRFIKGYIEAANLGYVTSTVTQEDGTVHFKVVNPKTKKG